MFVTLACSIQLVPGEFHAARGADEQERDPNFLVRGNLAKCLLQLQFGSRLPFLFVHAEVGSCVSMSGWFKHHFGPFRIQFLLGGVMFKECMQGIIWFVGLRFLQTQHAAKLTSFTWAQLPPFFPGGNSKASPTLGPLVLAFGRPCFPKEQNLRKPKQLGGFSGRPRCGPPWLEGAASFATLWPTSRAMCSSASQHGRSQAGRGVGVRAEGTPHVSHVLKTRVGEG